MKKVVKIEGLDCAHCASALERSLGKIDKLNSVNINFMAMKMIFECNDEDYDEVVVKIKEVTKKREPECKYFGI